MPNTTMPPGDPSAPVLELEQLSVRLGRRVILETLTATVTGRAIGLLGPNGAGKTTLISTLLGFHRPSSGRARVLGVDVLASPAEARALIGYMPEQDAFIEEMSGVRFVRYMGELSGLPPKVALERAHEALFMVGLGEARYRPVGSYSTGMKQCVKLAQALVHGPRLLILDEPTNGLDPAARERMLKLIQHVRSQDGVHVLLSSHLLRDVEQCCDQVLILKQGRIARHCDLEAERSAHEGLIELEVRGDADAFSNELGTVTAALARSSRTRFQLVLGDGHEIASIYRIAQRHDVQLRRVQYRRESLQDIFLKAMEDGDTRPEVISHGGL